MLRKIIKAIIPSRGEIFFELFIKAADNVHEASNLLAKIISAQNKSDSTELVAQLRAQRQKAVEINKDIAYQLNTQFITPIDRGEIHYIAGQILKLTKRIIKINQKLQLYAIDAQVDDCLIRCVNTLQEITKCLYRIMQALAKKDDAQMKAESQRSSELDEKVVEDLGHTLEEIKQANYDTLTIINLKEVYKAVESAIDTSATICDAAMRVYVKEI